MEPVEDLQGVLVSRGHNSLWHPIKSRVARARETLLEMLEGRQPLPIGMDASQDDDEDQTISRLSQEYAHLPRAAGIVAASSRRT